MLAAFYYMTNPFRVKLQGHKDKYLILFIPYIIRQYMNNRYTAVYYYCLATVYLDFFKIMSFVKNPVIDLAVC